MRYLSHVKPYRVNLRKCRLLYPASATATHAPRGSSFARIESINSPKQHQSNTGQGARHMPATQTAQKDPVIVVLQLTGGNDYLNTIIPDNNIIHLDGTYGIPDYMAPMKAFWDEGKLAICHGVGWKESPRSHFRAMDIWHTCEPIKVGTEGWLGRVAREFDPKKENVVQVVSMGPSLPRSLVAPGVPVACVAGPLERYGFLPQVQGNERAHVLDRFAKMYSPAIGRGPVMDYLSETAIDSLKGEDIIKVVPA